MLLLGILLLMLIMLVWQFANLSCRAQLYFPAPCLVVSAMECHGAISSLSHSTDTVTNGDRGGPAAWKLPAVVRRSADLPRIRLISSHRPFYWGRLKNGKAAPSQRDAGPNRVFLDNRTTWSQ